MAFLLLRNSTSDYFILLKKLENDLGGFVRTLHGYEMTCFLKSFDDGLGNLDSKPFYDGRKKRHRQDPIKDESWHLEPGYILPDVIRCHVDEFGLFHRGPAGSDGHFKHVRLLTRRKKIAFMQPLGNWGRFLLSGRSQAFS